MPLRSLQRYFLTILGVSPKQYILARKLDSARRAIRSRRHTACVYDIALEFGFGFGFGFVSASRFAEQFLRHFGQSPSKVLYWVSFSDE